MRPSVHLIESKQASVLRGHPWIFPKAIAKTKGRLITGELVDVVSHEGETICTGVFNEHSLYRVRVLAYRGEFDDEKLCFADIIKRRLQQAWQVRNALNLPNASTNAFRLCNSEGDGLSGLTIDYFNAVCVVSSSAYWVEKNRELITECIEEFTQCQSLIWLSQAKPLAQDGWQEIESSNIALQTEVLEAGVQFAVDFTQTQKTGLFLDQRENHQRVAALAKGKRVLDLYTYTGGFALHAAKAGASHVTAIDSSKAAIQQASANARLNQLDIIEFIEDDARNYLTNAGDYDIVVLDPPKLIPSRQNLQRAKNYYRFLHREVFKAMRSGSLLMTCNCSSAISAQEFAALVAAQASAVGKQARVLGVYGPASCHPVLPAFPEGNYLTAILLAVL
ncbi:SAM-dependent methyltransferase [Legionella birminghamensis]|uniref:SAM-dependent methyltransferase n=1 Tax=Legionella birminghamensis TaxID=28083 RepID=A0A378I9I6_9GAMM|nr:class I SAM-dependent rRNA methyltransferase [Legionella birminghamensis]KTC75182.1 SAM-dependent methyltransferase [Legionella birminghamensis]STX31867.1 SAM-dependent methyltransferase [Legionella birminghamensis]